MKQSEQSQKIPFQLTSTRAAIEATVQYSTAHIRQTDTRTVAQMQATSRVAH